MFPGLASSESSVFKLRIKDLVNAVKQNYPDQKGVIVLFGGFENDRIRFRQESSFYYVTGIEEPGVVVVIDLDGTSTVYLPNYAENRSKWIFCPIEPTQECAKRLGVDAIEFLGDQSVGYQCSIFFTQETYRSVLEKMTHLVAQKVKIFTLYPSNTPQYIEQRFILDRLQTFIPELTQNIVDISPIIAQLRRAKDMHEIELLYKAVQITSMAHEAAAKAITDGVPESDVQASLEYVMTSSGASIAFPSIVASGKNGTILHYMQNSGVIKNGELVVVDIGASSDYYCADLTRTYPVSGTFSKRQRELYEIVLATQEYIADIAKPGLWFSNKEHPEQSLHHLAKKFLAQKGYDEFFTHGIGHYLGIDVHDVGDYTKPLAEGDVITIEPGLYIPNEGIGIRIEDNYWIVKEGAVCLSEQLPKKPDDVENMVQCTFADDQQEDDSLESFDIDMALDDSDPYIKH
ncbi:MAG: aminopeptidase P N-terminal domain-containing protein [bacterium]|nr:aminopeptidase P N-terminal domain-containing protein [bacterium]